MCHNQTEKNCSQQGADGKVGAGAMRGSNQAPKSYPAVEILKMMLGKLV